MSSVLHLRPSPPESQHHVIIHPYADRHATTAKKIEAFCCCRMECSQADGIVLRHLQKVIRRSGTLVPAFISWRRVKLREFAMIVNCVFGALVDRIIHLHNRRLIATSVAVVGSGKYSDNLSVVLPLVSFHDKLVCT